MKKTINSILVLIICFAMTSCATIVDGGSKYVSVNVNPENAKIYVNSNRGERYVRQGSFNLAVNDRRAVYTLRVELPNYHSEEIIIKKGLNGWVFGNIVFGGPIGFIIDFATGNIWTPKPKFVSADLVKNADLSTLEGMPNTVKIEMPITVYTEDGKKEIVYIPMTFYKKALNGELA